MNTCQNCNHKFNSTNILCPNCGRYSKKERIWEGIEQVLPLFVNLNEKINQIKEDLYGKNIPRNDQRVETIDALGYVIFWAVIQLELFIPNFETKNAPGTKHILSTNTMSDEKLFGLIAKFDTMNRMSFLTLFLFQVETFLKSINSTLENKIQRKEYKKLISHIFEELEISDPNREKYMLYSCHRMLKIVFIRGEFIQIMMKMAKLMV